jgi:hypothetical protein
MTLQEARADLIAQDAYDPSLYKGTEYDAEGNQVEEAVGLTRLISDACVWWAMLTYCNEDPRISMVLTAGTSEYDGENSAVFSKRILKPRFVVVNDNLLYRRDGRRPGFWTLDELEYYREGWREWSNDEPTAAVWLNSGKLLLSAPPASAYTGNNFVSAWTLPDELEAGADDDAQLPVPRRDHPAIVRLALDYGTLPQAEGSKESRQFRNESWWREQAQRRKAENMAQPRGPRGSRAREWLFG